ncbi:hypothetical protein Ade02nite_76150 [Paractinoplanes deccanensis]|uniref:Tox-PL domain-containing protein n=1 Tax=Paractinoplanes deccanensis TaxID=113561 RepID=A0ABQ3YG33_9ACTN|nr:toxin glutamine deamidase domain-containing protein [Actinoplanes deccanensis]GID78974.1 hypothetical protein Ade02nite_76150 [Actinoplanes deccanensis]
MSVIPSPVPHPLEYSPFDVPGWAYEALEWVVGFDWPAGNEVATWDVADRWYALATALIEPNDAAFGAVSQILAGYEGAGADSFGEAWHRLAGDESAPLNALLEASNQLGALVEGAGRDIEGAKLEAWIEIGIFLIELIGMGVAVVLTLGAASPAAGGLIMATRLAIQQIFRKLVEQLGVKALRQAGTHAIKQLAGKEGLRKLGREALDEGFDEAREEVAVNGGIQMYQQSTGRADGFDLNDLRASAVAGFAGGAASSGAGVGSHGHGGVARGAGGEVLAEFGAAAAFGELPDGADLAKSATSGAAGSALHVGTPFSGPNLTIGSDLSSATPLLADAGSPSAPPMIASPLPGVASSEPALLAGSPDRTSSFESAVVAPPPAFSPGADAAPPAFSPGADAAPPATPLSSADPASPAVGAALSSSADPASPATGAAPSPSADPASPGIGSALSPSADAASSATAASSVPSATVSPAFSADVESPAAVSPSSPSPAFEPAGGPSFAASEPAPASPVQLPPTDATVLSASPPPPTTPASSAPSPSAGVVPFAPSPTAGVIPGSPRRAGTSATGTPDRLPPGTTWRSTVSDLDRIADALGPRPDVSRSRPPLPLDRTPSPLDRALRPADTTPLSDRPRTEPHPNAPRVSRPYISRVPDPRRSGPVVAVPLPHDLGPAPRRPLPEPDLARAEAAYFGYADHARRTHEENRREEYIAYLTTIADDNRAKILDLGRRADEAFRTGSTLRARDYRKQAFELSEIVAEIETQNDQIRSGALAPETVEVDPPHWARINHDVGDLAPAGVKTGSRSALTGTGGRPPIDATRRYNSVGGLRPPLAVHQVDLENAVPRDPDGRPTRLPDPRTGRWFRLANDGGPAADPTRGLNCVDGVLSLFDTYIHGRPRVAAPRTFDTYAHGDPTRPLGGELAGVDRIRQATGSDFQNLCPYLGGADPAEAKQAMDHAITNLTNHLLNTGHGAYAFIITDLEAGGCHSWAALNQNGTVLFVDPQIGKLTESHPLYTHQGVHTPTNIISMDALVVAANATPAPLPHHGPGHWSTTPPTGADESPETAAERLAFESLPTSEQRTLNDSYVRSLAIADRVLGDIRDVISSLPAAPETERLRVVDEQHRAKTVNSLARAFLQHAPVFNTTLDDFIAAQKDLVRFSIEVPLAGYGRSVALVLEALESSGYSVTKILSFWGDGLGRHNGLNVSLADPQGHLFELQFPTPLSRAVGKDTHRLYARVRNERFTPEERVEALLQIFSINRERGLPDNQPSDLDILDQAFPVTQKDTGLATWIGANRGIWHDYLRTLDAGGGSLDRALARHNLRYSDVMIPPEQAGTDYP